MVQHRTTRLTRRVALAATTATLAAVALSGCSTDDAGIAARVGSTELTIAQLQDQLSTALLADSKLTSLVGYDVTAQQFGIIANTVNHDLSLALAREQHITVKDAEIDSFLDSFAQQVGDLTLYNARQGFTMETLREAVQDELIRQKAAKKLGSEQAYVDAMIRLGQERGAWINPRYGRWDAQRGAVQGSGSVSVAGKLAGVDDTAATQTK